MNPPNGILKSGIKGKRILKFMLYVSHVYYHKIRLDCNVSWHPLDLIPGLFDNSIKHLISFQIRCRWRAGDDLRPSQVAPNGRYLPRSVSDHGILSLPNYL